MRRKLYARLKEDTCVIFPHKEIVPKGTIVEVEDRKHIVVIRLGESFDIYPIADRSLYLEEL